MNKLILSFKNIFIEYEFFAFLVFLLIVIITFLLGLTIGKYKEHNSNQKNLQTAREDAVKRSRAVLNGQLSEQLAPFFPDFPANPTEIRFIGKPIDYIAFNGSANGHITDISFIEVKSGSSTLNKTERSLKDAIEKKKIRYIEYRVNFNKN